jgi:type I restriction enzyme S subunit
LYPDEFLRIPVVCPPPAEQAAIVRFLDYADRKIRRYIRAKQQLIKLLEEQITARASCAMRHPACAYQRLGSVASEQVRFITREDVETYVALGLFNRGRGIFHKRPTLGAELGDSTFSWVEPGDLVISGQFAWEGSVALASSTEKRTIVSHRYYLLRGIQGRTTEPYLWALLRSDFGAMLLGQHSRGAAGRNRPLNLRTLLKEKIPIPPYEMQLAVDQELASTAPLRLQASQVINFLHEYRTLLIANVVTGKLDVREAAAGLPEEVMEHESDEDEDGVEPEFGEEDLELNGDAEV